MILRDDIAVIIDEHLSAAEAADAILALIRAHMTSDEAVKRAASAWINTDGQDDMRAAILAALEGDRS